MKHWYFLLFILLITGCNKDEKELEYSEIKIEKNYPYSCEKKPINDIDKDTLELFSRNFFLINSDVQLNENPLFKHFSEELKDALKKCNFEKQTLIIIASSFINEVTGLKSNLGYNNYSSEYICTQTVYCKNIGKPVESVYLIISAFSVNKIPNDSKLVFNSIMLPAS